MLLASLRSSQGTSPRAQTPTPGAKSPSVKRSSVDGNGVHKMQWGVLPSKMPSLNGIMEAVSPGAFVVSVNETNPKERTGAIAKKLYTQLTSLYAHYGAIKVKYDAQQGLIDGAERKARNANIKTRKAQSRFSALKAELGEEWRGSKDEGYYDVARTPPSRCY